MRTTVGPLPPEVYWRRRLALIGVLVVALVGVRACAGNGTSRAGTEARRSAATSSASPEGTAEHPYSPQIASPTSSPKPSSSSLASPSASARPLSGPCTDAELLLNAVASSRNSQVGTPPKLVMTVRNIGTRACARDLGPSARELFVTSGPAHTWSTDDCHPGGVHWMVTLKPAAIQTVTETWDGRRSLPKCRGGQPAATAGTYLVQAKLGTLRSETSVFRLT